jgi:hypothetical protein
VVVLDVGGTVSNEQGKLSKLRRTSRERFAREKTTVVHERHCTRFTGQSNSSTTFFFFPALLSPSLCWHVRLN